MKTLPAVAFALVTMAFGTVGKVQAGEIIPCENPFAFDSAVNLYVLEDATPDATEDLRDARRRLAWLVKLDALFHDSYGSLGVHLLTQSRESPPCTLDQTVERVRRLRPHEFAAAIVDQHVYREHEQILVQSYLRFFRTDGDKRIRVESVTIAQGSGRPAFSEQLPSQRVAFPPQALTNADLSQIEMAFVEASKIYPEPQPRNGRPLPFSSKQPVPFLVTEVRPDGWMRIDAGPLHGDLHGWLHSDPQISARLREKLPEYNFVEGVVGYLSWLQALDGYRLTPERATGILRRADTEFVRYVTRAMQTQKGDMSISVAAVLRAAMALNDPARAGAVLPSLVGAVRDDVPDSRLRDLLGITRIAACCRLGPLPLGEGERAAWLVGLANALNDFQGALAIFPANIQALRNLEAAYAVLGQVNQYPVAVRNAPVPAELREAYDRAVTRLPESRNELNSRISAVRVLLSKMPARPD